MLGRAIALLFCLLFFAGIIEQLIENDNNYQLESFDKIANKKHIFL